MIIAFIALLGLSNCNPKDDGDECKNFPTEYYKLTDEQKAMLPYTGYDTISMVNNTGDTIRCIGTGKQYFNTREFELYANPECAAQGKGTEMFYEAYKIEFVDSVKNEKIELAQYFNYMFTKSIWTYNLIEVKYKDWGGRFFVYADHISNKDAYNYIGDVTVNNYSFNKTNKAYRYNDYYRIPLDSASFMYINRNNGILKLQLNNSETWELIPN